MHDFHGKVALVTGGSLGIGKATVRRFAQGGASVVFCGKDRESVEQAQAELRAEGLMVSGQATDVTSASQVKELIDITVATYEGLDILVNSAGIQRYGTVVDTDEEMWDLVLDTNLKGMYLTAKYTIPEMRKRGGGAIVNVSSVQAFASQKMVAAYTASKGGINALTRAMALDHAAEHIRVNVVCPASVDTPMLRWAADLFRDDKTNDQMVKDWGSMHPLGRVGTAEEVAELIAFLASPKAAFITGSEYKLDGGLLAAISVALPE